MGKLIDRPQEQSPNENDTKVRETSERVMPSTAPFVPETPHREEATPSQTKRPIRWMHWLAGIVLLAVVAGLVVFAVGNDGSEPVAQPTPRSAVNGEVWATQPLLITTPRSAVNGEVWATPLLITTPRSADGYEGWLRSITPATPISALGGEVWAESITSE